MDTPYPGRLYRDLEAGSEWICTKERQSLTYSIRPQSTLDTIQIRRLYYQSFIRSRYLIGQFPI
jgi:hypothetical protein